MQTYGLDVYYVAPLCNNDKMLFITCQHDVSTKVCTCEVYERSLLIFFVLEHLLDSKYIVGT